MNTSEILSSFFLYVREWTIKTLKSIPVENVTKAPGKNLNTILWISGHLLWAEENLLYKPLGKYRVFEGFKIEDFAMGTKPSGVKKYKKFYTLIIKYLEESKEISGSFIENVKEKDWNKKWKGEYSRYFPTIYGAVRHFIFHESSHAGQLWIIRKMLCVKIKYIN